MRVLITAHSLLTFGGVQTCVRDLAGWLLERSHSPVVYAPNLGEAAEQLRSATIPVTDDLASITVAPDVIHGNATVQTMAAMLHFADAPAIYVCHGWTATPPRFPRILRYVAVDDTCADRLLCESGIPADRTVVMLNAVDTRRFVQRDSLPSRPRRALLFGNTAHELTHASEVREACRRGGVELDVIGYGADRTVPDPENVIGAYDIVFAKAKCALEAMATGAAVVVCDVRGVAGMVSSANFDRLRRLNFGVRSLTQSLNADVLQREMDRYSPEDAKRVSDLVRRVATNDTLHEDYLALYGEVIEEHRAAPRMSWPEESRAAAAFLQDYTRDEAERQQRANLVVRASHHVLKTPLIGPALARAARWLIRSR